LQLLPAMERRGPQVGKMTGRKTKFDFI